MREICKLLRTKLDAKLAELGKEFGFSIKVDGIMRYSEDHIKCKIIAIKLNPTTGETETLEATDFRHCAKFYGLAETDLNRSFKFQGNTYTIVGAKPRSNKFPILCKRYDGKIFKFSPENIKILLSPAE